MLNRYKIDAKYYIVSDDGKKGKLLSSTEADNEDFSIVEIVSEPNRIKLTLTPKEDKKLVFEKLAFAYRYDFIEGMRKDAKVYVNGYQSWTDTCEYSLDEHTPLFAGPVKTLMKLTGTLKSSGFESYGDYRFASYSKKAGSFHGFSYMYVRNSSSVDLWGSLREDTGYTAFYVDVAAKRISMVKELEGVTIRDAYEVLNAARYTGGYDEVFDAYFGDLGIAKPKVAHKCGYTSWYNYYQKISENIILRDLEELASCGKPIDIFQIDDGYQTAVGDWLSINPKKFPNGLAPIVDAIHSKGMRAGLWLAPFGAQKNSQLVKAHPDWFVADEKGKKIKAGANWGGFYTLDIYNDEARNYIKNVFDTVLDTWGFDMVKLDFLYQVSIKPYGNRSRGEIMTDAMNFLRECVGDKLILGCGVPLFPAFGKVDFCRIGADIGLKWNNKTMDASQHRERVSTPNAINNAVFRRHLDGRAFCNDPDVFLLRDKNIKLNKEQKTLLTTVNKVFGNLLFTSDNVGSYTKDYQKEAFAEAVTPSEIKVVSAEYIADKILFSRYYIDGVATELTVDMKKGSYIKRAVDSFPPETFDPKPMFDFDKVDLSATELTE